MKKRIFCWAGSLFCLLSQLAWGQTATADTSASAGPLGQLSRYYAAGLGYGSRLYNGAEYVNYVKPYVEGHPFFQSATEQEGTVTYDGTTYPGVPLRYDLLQGQLVLSAPQGGLLMQLVREKVTAFDLGGHSFIRLVVDSTANSAVRTGFYDLLLEGPVRVLAARRKDLQERNTSDGRTGELTPKDELFIFKDNRYYPVSSAGSVLSLFPESKAALRKYSRSHRLRFRKARREQDMVELMRYAATLTAPAALPSPQ